MMLLETALVEPTGVKHNFQPGAAVPAGMPTRSRDNVDRIDELGTGFVGGFTEPDTQRPVP